MELNKILEQTVEEGDCLLWTGSLASSGSSPLIWNGQKMVAVRPIYAGLIGIQPREGGKFWVATCGHAGCISHIKHLTPTEHSVFMNKMLKNSPSEMVRRAKISAYRKAKYGIDDDVKQAILKHVGNSSEAAADLGVSRSTVSKYRRVVQGVFAGLGAR